MLLWDYAEIGSGLTVTLDDTLRFDQVELGKLGGGQMVVASCNLVSGLGLHN